MVLQRYIDFFELASSMVALAFGLGVTVAVLLRLKFKGVAGAGSRVFLGFAGACLVPVVAAFCLQVPLSSWWSGACIVLGIFVGGTIWVKAGKNSGGGGFFMGLIGFFVVRLALEWSGPIIVAPVLKYVLGYAVAVLSPIALAVLVGLALVRLGRVRPRLVWPMVGFLYFVGGTIFVLVGPLLAEGVRGLAGDALVALLPCIGVCVMFSIKRTMKVRVLCVLALYAFVAALLFRSAAAAPDAPASPLAVALLSLPVALGACVVLLGIWAVGIYRVILNGPGLFAEIPSWVVVMPWLSLVPAFYFAGLGVGWFSGFVALNLAIGLIFAAVFVLPAGIFRPPDPGPLRAAPTRRRISDDRLGPRTWTGPDFASGRARPR